jgi:hypothetical protein
MREQDDIIDPQLSNAHYASLRALFGPDHFDLFDWIAAYPKRFDQKALEDPKIWAGYQSKFETELAKRGISGTEAIQIRRLAFCALFTPDVNRELAAILRSSAYSMARTERFYVAFQPDPRFDVFVEQVSNNRWQLSISSGFRFALADATVLFSEVLAGRSKPDFATHLASNIRSVIRGGQPRPYAGIPAEHVARSAIWARFALLFILCHELSHVAAHVDRMRFRSLKDEELFADQMGQWTYLSAALMKLPLFQRLQDEGKIKTFAERSQIHISDPIAIKLMEALRIGKKIDIDTANFDYSKSLVYRNKEELKEYATYEYLIWLSPLLVFNLIASFEREMKNLGLRLPSSHPNASKRVRAFWSVQPDKRVWNAIDSNKEVKAALHNLFGSEIAPND